MYYVEVAVGVERHWNNAIFTYSSDTPLPKHTFVRVPFGNKKKLGLVLKTVSKPSFDAKPVIDSYDATMSDATYRFMRWFQAFYDITDGQVFMQFLPSYVGKKHIITSNSSAIADIPPLTKSQKRAFDEISAVSKASVLHGITGSGKTRIYLELIKNTMHSGKNSLVLYPEIALTNQLVSELEKIGNVVRFHSQLTNQQRAKLWQQTASSEEPLIIAGPRSALFLPHKNLGLIIIDEAHESSFKQESDIRYNALLTAGGLANEHSAKLVLGSATPPITETEMIIKSGGSLVELHEKALDADHDRRVHVINLKDKNQFKKHNLLSDTLLRSIKTSLQQGKQSLLFINRRGTAKLLFCDQCDWQADCEKCELPMTYHHDKHRMICHTCGSTTSVLKVCPECDNTLSLRSLGSKALVEEVASLLPGARIGRFDSDTKQNDSFIAQYEEVKSGKIDILIGTQQLAKGLDLPKLRTVGVLQADLSMHFPDYSSSERTFQLISQVAGRVDRGHGESEIVVQTYQPSSRILSQALDEDWSTFRIDELKERKLHGFPPEQFFAKIIARDKSVIKATKLLQKTKESIIKLNSSVMIDGPLPSFYAKKNGYYYMQLQLRAVKRSDLLRATKSLPASLIKEFDPITLL